MTIGVLAVQGAFIEHIQILEKLNNLQNENSFNQNQVEKILTKEIRQKSDLNGIDAIILPGGESTVQGQLLHKLDIFNDLVELIKNGLPVLATCAGLILLAESIQNDEKSYLKTLPICVKRNSYGRQLASFVTTNDFSIFTDESKTATKECSIECEKTLENYPMVFIRAPTIEKVCDDVKVLSKVQDKIVAVQYKNQIGLTFHPELTNDTRLHEYFVEMVRNVITL